MAIPTLNTIEHKKVLERLINISKSINNVRLHPAGIEYTSLMICFFKHNVNAAECVLRLYELFGDEYFPATVGYSIIRPMFEIDVTAHYISIDRSNLSARYISYKSIFNKKQMDACGKHRSSKNSNWREAMEMAWQHDFEVKQKYINSEYDSVCLRYANNNKKGKVANNWSGKSIRQMAIEVNHEEAYDLFYADLSSFTHADVRLADRFLHLNSDGISWSSQSRDQDICGVFRYADIFLDCFLRFFGREFNTWPEKLVGDCWIKDSLN